MKSTTLKYFQRKGIPRLLNLTYLTGHCRRTIPPTPGLQNFADTPYQQATGNNDFSNEMRKHLTTLNLHASLNCLLQFYLTFTNFTMLQTDSPQSAHFKDLGVLVKLNW
jgi:hypothetical protein